MSNAPQEPPARHQGPQAGGFDFGQAWAVVVTEVRAIVRDRRAFFTAVVLPILLYPVMFLLMDVMEKNSEERVEAKTHRVALELSELPGDVAERLWATLAQEQWNLELVPADPACVAASRSAAPSAEDLLVEDSVVLAVAQAPPKDDGKLSPPRLELFFDAGDSDSQVAAGRLREAAAGLVETVERELILDTLGSDPAELVATKEVDLAPAEDAAGHALGKLLPLIAVLVLVSSASFASLSAFAGEREAGTLETLLVQPVPGVTLAAGKMAAIALVGFLALVGNAVSFLGSAAAGLGGLQGFSGDAMGAGAGRVLGGVALVFPTALFLCAATALVSARARTFREGQNLILPLTIFTTALAAPVAVDRVTLDPLLALIPVTGGTLAFRDALSGNLRTLPAAVAWLASSGWAWLLIRRVGHLLDAERLLREAAVAGETAARRIQSRRALAWGFGSVLLIFVVGGWLQAQSLVAGLTLTLWGLALGLALLSARGTARRAGESIPKALWLRAPRLPHLAVAILAAPGLARVVLWLADKQAQFLPIPQMQGEFVQALGDLSLWSSLFLFALSPGICEELLFRGAILSGLRRDLGPAKVIAWQALLFGLVHASIYRFVPTALLGAILASLTLRARSLWPAILLHSTYNAVLVSGLLDPGSSSAPGPAPWVATLLSPLATTLAALLALALFLRFPGRDDAPKR